MFDLDSFRDFFQFYSKFLQFFNFQSEEKFSEDVLVFIFLPNFLHIFHKLFTIFTNHSLFWFQLLALWNIGDEGWNFVKKKKKKFTSLGSSRKLSFTNHWTNEIHPLSTFVHEHNLTFEKIFDTYDISIKKLLRAL